MWNQPPLIGLLSECRRDGLWWRPSSSLSSEHTCFDTNKKVILPASFLTPFCHSWFVLHGQCWCEDWLTAGDFETRVLKRDGLLLVLKVKVLNCNVSRAQRTLFFHTVKSDLCKVISWASLCQLLFFLWWNVVDQQIKGCGPKLDSDKTDGCSTSNILRRVFRNLPEMYQIWWSQYLMNSIY